MELELIRNIFTENSSIGRLSVNGNFECFTLEDKDRGLDQSMDVKVINQLKVYGKTAIPCGRYKVDLTVSNRFKKLLPILIDVKGYEGVRIHTGNTEADSLGCVLVGMAISKDTVTQSIVAMNRLMVKLQGAKDKKEDIYLTISNNSRSV